MARIKRGVTSHPKHKKLLNRAKGYRMTRNRLVRKAQEAVLHAQSYSFAGRRDRKSQLRREWILHINQALRERALSYSQFQGKLRQAKIELNRKMLAELIVSDPAAFQSIIDKIN